MLLSKHELSFYIDVSALNFGSLLFVDVNLPIIRDKIQFDVSQNFTDSKFWDSAFENFA